MNKRRSLFNEGSGAQFLYSKEVQQRLLLHTSVGAFKVGCAPDSLMDLRISVEAHGGFQLRKLKMRIPTTPFRTKIGLSYTKHCFPQGKQGYPNSFEGSCS